MRKLKGILFILLLCSPTVIYAQETSRSFSLVGDRLLASIAVSNPPAKRVVESLQEGLESEVQYNIRVYERTGGLLGLFGDRLIGEVKRTMRARWDEFTGDYVVTSERLATRKTTSSRVMLDDLFRLSGLDTGIRLNPNKEYYVLSNVQIQIVRLVPPLTMIGPFISNRQIDTQWVRTEISQQ